MVEWKDSCRCSTHCVPVFDEWWKRVVLNDRLDRWCKSINLTEYDVSSSTHTAIVCATRRAIRR